VYTMMTIIEPSSSHISINSKCDSINGKLISLFTNQLKPMFLSTSGPSLWSNHSQYSVQLSHYLRQLSEKKYLEPARTKFS